LILGDKEFIKGLDTVKDESWCAKQPHADAGRQVLAEVVDQGWCYWNQIWFLLDGFDHSVSIRELREKSHPYYSLLAGLTHNIV